MLCWLKIKNLALIEEADIEFGGGLNVITGETGAGKSVIIGSLNMLFGDRADKGSIRSGSSRCEVSAGLSLEKAHIAPVLELLEKAGAADSADFGDSGELQIKRIISRTSSRIFVNDSPVTLKTLKAIGEMLFDVHSPGQNQSLFRQSAQLELLDSFSGNASLVSACSSLWDKIKDTETQIQEFSSRIPSPVEAEHLRLVISEIEKVAPGRDEEKDLTARHALASNSKQILHTASACVSGLNESEGSVGDRLSEIFRMLSELQDIDSEGVSPLVSQCGSIVELARELAQDIEHYTRNVELDEKELFELEERMSSIQTLKRRYGPSMENVFNALESAREKLDKYENSEEELKKLYSDKEKFRAELEKNASKLSAARKKAAVKLSGKIKKELEKLGFLKSGFDVEFSEIPAGPAGCDKIDFMFSANPGEALKPLRDVASSGEISRVMLALKTVLAKEDKTPILVFDEIDVNIGGETAVTVGEEIKKLSQGRQVLSITHLPQVAACAAVHFMVSKSFKKKRTFTEIQRLEGNAVKQEVARMLGGGKAAARHAAELLKK